MRDYVIPSVGGAILFSPLKCAAGLPVRCPGSAKPSGLPRRPGGYLFLVVVAMTDGPSLFAPEVPATALPAWLESLVDLMPETIVLHVEISSALVLVAFLWLLLRPPWRDG